MYKSNLCHLSPVLLLDPLNGGLEEGGLVSLPKIPAKQNEHGSNGKNLYEKVYTCSKKRSLTLKLVKNNVLQKNFITGLVGIFPKQSGSGRSGADMKEIPEGSRSHQLSGCF